MLQIEVLEDLTLNRTAIVLPDGQISLPLAGSVRAAGRSLAQVQADLAARLAPNFATAPTVDDDAERAAERTPSTPAAPRLSDIYVLGAATTPGKVEVKQGATLLQALAQAAVSRPLPPRNASSCAGSTSRASSGSTSSISTPSSAANDSVVAPPA